jgi:hypothetical protein
MVVVNGNVLTAWTAATDTPVAERANLKVIEGAPAWPGLRQRVQSHQGCGHAKSLDLVYPVSIWDRASERVTSRIDRTVKTPT